MNPTPDPATELSSLLGHDSIADHIVAAVSSDGAMVSLSGRSGTGKTELVKGALRQKLEKKGFAVLWLCGDEDKKDQTFILLESVIAAYQKRNERKKNVAVGLAKTADGLSPLKFFSGLATIFQNAENLPARNIESLSASELSSLEMIFSLAKRQELLIIVDQFLWSDHYSLRFLEKLMSGEFDDERRLSKKLRLLCVLTDEHLERSNHGTAKEFLAQYIPQEKQFRLERIEEGQVSTALRFFGFNRKISKDEIRYLHRISEGNLEILFIVARYLLEKGEIYPAILSRDDFVIRTVYKRIIHAEDESDWDMCLYQLSSYSLIGDRFLKHQSNCMHESNGDAIQLALDANILREYSEDEYEFAHETHKVMLSNVAKPHKRDIHKKIASCLGKIVPSNYEARAHHLFQAGQGTEATVFLVVSAIRHIQQLRNLTDVFPPETRELLRISEHESTLRVFVEAYRHFNANRFKEAILAVNSITLDAPLILQAERDYLEALSRLELHNLKEANQACELLGTWDDLYGEGEIELWARIKVIYLQGLVLQGKIEQARNLEREIVKKIKKSSSHDNALRHLLFVLNRKASAIKTAPVARQGIKKAAEYFIGRYPENEPVDILELYKCLINLTAALLNNGQYEMAYNKCGEVLGLITHYRNLTFPRVDLLLNNATIAAYRSDQIDLQTAIDQQEAVVGSRYCNKDDHIQRSNLAGFHVLSGNQTEARAILDELEEEIAERSIDESYIVYNMLSNRLALTCLERDEKEFDETLKRLNKMIAGLEWPAIDEIRKRVVKMQESFRDLFDLTPTDLDTAFIETKHRQTEWDFYGRTVALCELQFWASS